MGRKLNPNGGDGDFIAFKSVKGDKAKLTELAHDLGFNSMSEFLRAISDHVIETRQLPDGVVVPPHDSKELSRAS